MMTYSCLINAGPYNPIRGLNAYNRQTPHQSFSDNPTSPLSLLLSPKCQNEGEREKKSVNPRGFFAHFSPLSCSSKNRLKKIHKLIIFSPVDVKLTDAKPDQFFSPVRAIDWDTSEI